MQLMSVRKSDPGVEKMGVEKMSKKMCEGGQEGVMSVETGSTYNGGQRSGHQAVA